VSPAAFDIPEELARAMRQWQQRFLVAGAAGLAVSIAGALREPDQFVRSYLWCYMFFIGVTLGCLAVNMLQYLTGGAWGMVIRRQAEAAARTLPLLAILFVPIALGIPRLYVWAHRDLVAADEILRNKSVYLNVPFFLIRAAVYFAGWGLLAGLLNKWSREHDESGSESAYRRPRILSGPGLVFYGFSVTFMALDWVLSIEPHLFSTMFGLLFMVGEGLSALAFVIAVTVVLARRPPLADAITPRHLHDLGKLMLAFVMLWAYMAFSQFLIIWAGNLPDEIPWYVERLRGGWQFVGLALVMLHFALPFALLLSRDVKRDYRLLARVAVLILAMRLVDLYWMVAPSFRRTHFGVSWMDFVLPIGIGGVWLAYFTRQLSRRSLMPVRDPQLEEALAHGRE
jgi:hypothetical protein